jgi:hypothetical protein
LYSASWPGVVGLLNTTNVYLAIGIPPFYETFACRPGRASLF